jgi:hypothetical protein
MWDTFSSTKPSVPVMFRNGEARKLVRDPTPKSILTRWFLQGREPKAMVTRHASIEVGEDEGAVRVDVGGAEGLTEEGMLLNSGGSRLDVKADDVHAVVLELNNKTKAPAREKHVRDDGAGLGDDTAVDQDGDTSSSW